MKKLLSFILIGLFALVLMACTPEEEPDPDADTTPPTIQGATNKTINVGDEFDPLAGVTATDDVDGEITLTMANVSGTVNVNAVGEYTLTYQVSDAAGNQSNPVVRKITVVMPVLGNLINGDFSNGLQGYTTWFDAGNNRYAATYNVVNGVLEIDITTADPADTQWWGVQVQWNATNLDAFTSYVLEFDVKADDPRYMNYQIQGGTPGVIGGGPGGTNGKAFGEMNITEIGPEWKTVSKAFYTKNSVENAQLQFAFGNFAADLVENEDIRVVPTKIYLDNIKIVYGAPLEPQAPTITVFNQTIPAGQPFVFGTGVRVEDDKDTITFNDLEKEQVAGDEFNPANPAVGVYTWKLNVTDSEGLEAQEVTYTITVSESWGRPTDLQKTDAGDWGLNVNTTAGWVEFEADGEWLTVTNLPEEDGVEIEITGIAPNDWLARYVLGGINMFPGTYTITFEAKTDSPNGRFLRFGSEQFGVFAQPLLGTDYATYTIVFETTTVRSNVGFFFYFGSYTTDRGGFKLQDVNDILTTVYLRNFEVDYAPAE